MLSPSGPVVVLWLHVLAACVWIGGQVLVALPVPMLRGHGNLASVAARRYQLVAWPAFGLLVVTGILNVGNAGLSWTQLSDSAAGRTLVVKLSFVAVSGATAAIHAFLQAPRRGVHDSGRPWASAALGSLSLLAAVAAALYGVVIAEA